MPSPSGGGSVMLPVLPLKDKGHSPSLLTLGAPSAILNNKLLNQDAGMMAETLGGHRDVVYAELGSYPGSNKLWVDQSP